MPFCRKKRGGAKFKLAIVGCPSMFECCDDEVTAFFDACTCLETIIMHGNKLPPSVVIANRVTLGAFGVFGSLYE